MNCKVLFVNNWLILKFYWVKNEEWINVLDLSVVLMILIFMDFELKGE